MSSFYHMLVLRFSHITKVEITGMELGKGTGIPSWREAAMEAARECVEVGGQTKPWRILTFK